MELRAGYKQTDVGVIPEAWEAHPLGKVLTLQRGFDLPKRLRRMGSIPIVTSSGIEDFHDQPAVKGPGVVTGRYGTIGNVYFVRDDYWPLNTTLWLRDFHGNEPLWAFQILQTVDFLSHSGKSGVPGINRNDVHGEIICVPPLPEQRAIAAALSDADALIASLDALIAKKRDLKQAAVQELLTGKTRLPGFTGEWELKRLGDVAQIAGGGTPSSSVASYWDGGILWCTPTDVTGTQGKYLGQTERTISAEGLKNSAATLIPPGSLLLCTRATLGEVKIAVVPISTNQGFKSLICHPGISNEFMYYLLLTMKQAMIKKSSGSTFLELSKRDLSALKIKLPGDRAEQIAIAEVLSDMDADIAALEAQATKSSALKQGLMQELLTGRIRLV